MCSTVRMLCVLLVAAGWEPRRVVAATALLRCMHIDGTHPVRIHPLDGVGVSPGIIWYVAERAYGLFDAPLLWHHRVESCRHSLGWCALWTKTGSLPCPGLATSYVSWQCMCMTSLSVARVSGRSIFRSVGCVTDHRGWYSPPPTTSAPFGGGDWRPEAGSFVRGGGGRSTTRRQSLRAAGGSAAWPQRGGQALRRGEHRGAASTTPTRSLRPRQHSPLLISSGPGRLLESGTARHLSGSTTGSVLSICALATSRVSRPSATTLHCRRPCCCSV